MAMAWPKLGPWSRQGDGPVPARLWPGPRLNGRVRVDMARPEAQWPSPRPAQASAMPRGIPWGRRIFHRPAWGGTPRSRDSPRSAYWASIMLPHGTPRGREFSRARVGSVPPIREASGAACWASMGGSAGAKPADEPRAHSQSRVKTAPRRR